MSQIKSIQTGEEMSENPKVIVEHLYRVIKGLAKDGHLHSEELYDLADLITKLANRLKVEEADGESQG